MEKANQQYGGDVTGYQSITKKKEIEPERLVQISNFLSEILGETFSKDMDLIKVDLKDGTVLCRLVNAIQPNTCKGFKTSKVVFVCRSNIQIYIEACRKVGMAELFLFETRDLFDVQRPWAVLDNIERLSGISRKLGFQGPFVGPKLADENKRNFTQEQLHEANKKMMDESFKAHKK